MALPLAVLPESPEAAAVVVLAELLLVAMAAMESMAAVLEAAAAELLPLETVVLVGPDS